jgi:hypothetical protein
MREENCPRIVDKRVEVDIAVGGFGSEVWRN